MNKTQINKLRMFESVNLVLTNHSHLFAQLEDLVLGHLRLQQNILQIGQYRQVQETNNSGLTDVKIDLRTQVITQELQFCAALKSLATSTNNLELKAKVNYSKSDLVQSPDPVLYDIGILLVNLATLYQPSLIKYFVTPEKLLTANNLLTNFYGAIPQKRVANSMSKVSTLNISKTFKTTFTMLKEETDVLMLLFEESEPDFYRAYKNARIIIDYSGRSTVDRDTSVPD